MVIKSWKVVLAGFAYNVKGVPDPPQANVLDDHPDGPGLTETSNPTTNTLYGRAVVVVVVVVLPIGRFVKFVQNPVEVTRTIVAPEGTVVVYPATREAFGTPDSKPLNGGESASDERLNNGPVSAPAVI